MDEYSRQIEMEFRPYDREVREAWVDFLKLNHDRVKTVQADPSNPGQALLVAWQELDAPLCWSLFDALAYADVRKHGRGILDVETKAFVLRAGFFGMLYDHIPVLIDRFDEVEDSRLMYVCSSDEPNMNSVVRVVFSQL